MLVRSVLLAFLGEKAQAGWNPYLSSPTMHEEEKLFVIEAINENWVSTVGRNINELEKMMAAYVGTNYAVALASGTSALHLCMRLAGIKKDEPVFCSDTTFGATVNPVVYEHGKPVFIDSEYDTCKMPVQAQPDRDSKYHIRCQ